MKTILKELNVVWDDLSEDRQLAIAESIAGKVLYKCYINSYKVIYF